MTYKIFKTTVNAVIVFLVFSLAGCVKKNDATYTDFSQLQDHVILRSSGINNLKAANLRIDNTSATPDSIEIYAELASVNASNSPVVVTLGVDSSQITTYNAANGTTYQLFPAGSYKLVSNTITITPGNHYASTYLVIDQTMFDPTISYMLPVLIQDASGKALTTNQNTVYYNIIGNSLAGKYAVSGTRYNFVGAVPWSGPPASIPSNYTATTDLTNEKVASPDDAFTIEVDFANVGAGYSYIITYNPSSQSISVTYSDPILAYSNLESYVASFTPPSATQKASFHIITHYNNAAAGAGNDRIMDETFVQQ